MTQKFSTEKQVALEAVKQAVKIAISLQKNLKEDDVLQKSDNSPVTVADFSCQAVINLHLSKHFPNDAIKSEEESSYLRANPAFCARVEAQVAKYFPHLSQNELFDAIDHGKKNTESAKRFWTLDPIDGTKGFVRKEQYAIGLALIEMGEVVVSMMAAPRVPFMDQEGGIFFAVKNEGAFCNPFESDEEIRLKIDPEAKILIYCEPHISSTSHSHQLSEQIVFQINDKALCLRVDSQIKYVLIALNLASIYLRVPTDPKRKEKVWDHAPGLLLIQEAGGKVSDLKGQVLDFTKGIALSANHGVIASSNELLHDRLIAIARKIIE
jgi:HAL2 family 3'(2'),5'-bisphosphate nucleotidase